MKIIHIPAKSTTTVDLSGIKAKLPKKILLFTTSQYINQILDIKKQLGEDCDIISPKQSHASYKGQVLGCSKLTKEEVKGYDAILYIGDGLFHPLAVLNDAVDVYCFNPRSKELTKLDESHFKEMEKKKKRGLNMFYHSKEIGVLISTKFGQKRNNLISMLSKNYPDKIFYPILFDTIDFSRLMDFNFLEMYINTACPRIAVDDDLEKPCINISDLEELKIVW